MLIIILTIIWNYQNNSAIFDKSIMTKQLKLAKMKNEHFNIFTEKQMEAIKLILKDGLWGDCDMEFGTSKETSYAYGYYTNIGRGKEWSGLLSGISKTIKSSGTNAIKMCPNWWGDNSGDMMFFNLEIFDKEELKKFSV